MRLLDRALHWVTELPTLLFPPDTHEDELLSIHRTPGLSIVHTDWGIYRSDLDQLHPSALSPDSHGSGDIEIIDDEQDGAERSERSEEGYSDSDKEYIPEPGTPLNTARAEIRWGKNWRRPRACHLESDAQEDTWIPKVGFLAARISLSGGDWRVLAHM